MKKWTAMSQAEQDAFLRVVAETGKVIVAADVFEILSNQSDVIDPPWVTRARVALDVVRDELLPPGTVMCMSTNHQSRMAVSEIWRSVPAGHRALGDLTNQGR